MQKEPSLGDGEDGGEKKERKRVRKRKPKKDVDPNRPKRPQTAYFIWFLKKRPDLKEEFPDLGMTDLSKKAGELWREMTAEDKKARLLLFLTEKVVL